MTTTLAPYLNFRGNAREAMTFYQSVFGGELTVSTFSDFGMPVAPEEADQVMHSQLKAPGELVIMGSDTPSHMELTVGNNVSVSVSGTDEAGLTAFWEGISDGATVTAPLMAAPWGDIFGMCTDRFGIGWLFNIGATPAE